MRVSAINHKIINAVLLPNPFLFFGELLKVKMKCTTEDYVTKEVKSYAISYFVHIMRIKCKRKGAERTQKKVVCRSR